MYRRGLYDTTRGKSEERYIDWQIASAKAVVCIRRFRSTNEWKWLDLAERHIKGFNGFLREVDRVSGAVADVVAFVGARRVG